MLDEFIPEINGSVEIALIYILNRPQVQVEIISICSRILESGSPACGGFGTLLPENLEEIKTQRKCKCSIMVHVVP